MRFIFAIFFVAAIVCAAQGSSPIEAQQHRAEIRAALLEQTPIGSSLSRVQQFIGTKLLPKNVSPPRLEDHGATGESAVGALNKGVKSIRLELGHYFENSGTIFLTAPLINQKEVVVQWAFDEHDRLVDVFVDKRVQTY
jgi:hypothetical protein